MSDITCTNIKANLSAYFDNTLDAEQSNIVKEHLRSCATCAKEFDELSEIMSLLPMIKDVRVPDSFDVGLRQGLKNEKAKKTSNFKRKIAMISSVAAVFVIGIFSITMYNYMNSSDDDANWDTGISPAIMHDAAGGVLPEFDTNIERRSFQIGESRQRYSDIDSLGNMRSLENQERESLPFVSNIIPYTSYTHERQITRTQRDLSLALSFLYEQYYVESSGVNLNLINVNDMNISSRFTGLRDRSVFVIELITDDLTEVHTLLVRDGKVGLLGTEVFDYARPVRPELVIGDTLRPALKLHDVHDESAF